MCLRWVLGLAAPRTDGELDARMGYRGHDLIGVILFILDLVCLKPQRWWTKKVIHIPGSPATCQYSAMEHLMVMKTELLCCQSIITLSEEGTMSSWESHVIASRSFCS